jgi:TRAP-type C4-dicarboxylate transport system substrate-binding protein
MDDGILTRGLLTRREALKTAGTLALGLSTAGFIAACGGSPTSAPTASGGALGPVKYKLRAAATTSPTDYNSVSYYKFIELVKQKTNGAVHIDFFPSGQLGSEADSFKGTQTGVIDMAAVGTAPANATIPETLLLDLPYVFKDMPTFHRLANSALTQSIEKKYEALGTKVLAWKCFGIRHIGAKEFFPTPDMHNTKVRVQQSPLWVALFKAFHSVPVPLSNLDVYNGLQTGLVAGYDQPLNGILSFKWYEPAGNITLSYHAFTTGMYSMNKQLFDSMPKNIQTALMDAAAASTADHDLGWAVVDTAARAQLTLFKATFLEPDLAPWRQAATTIYPQFASQVGGQSVIDKLLASQ